MMLAEIWTDLESQASPGMSGRLQRRLAPESFLDLHAVVELYPRERRTRRALELGVAAKTVAKVEVPPGTRLVQSVIVDRAAGRAALVLALDEPDAADLFGAMCEDVARAVATTRSEAEAVRAWDGRYSAWRRMLQGRAEGLSAERQRGLFAELLAIREILAPDLGIVEAIAAWAGPDRRPRDFESRGVALEVKSSAANEPQVATINGERQLDDIGLRALLLLHTSIEAIRGIGETLPDVVESIRTLADGTAARGALEDRLLAAEYADAHAPMYRHVGYTVRRTRLFRVADGFPRITEVDLPDGIGGIRYSLVIDACADFEIDLPTARAILSERS